MSRRHPQVGSDEGSQVAHPGDKEAILGVAFFDSIPIGASEPVSH